MRAASDHTPSFEVGYLIPQIRKPAAEDSSTPSCLI
jgi:hypothetical protein